MDFNDIHCQIYIPNIFDELPVEGALNLPDPLSPFAPPLPSRPLKWWIRHARADDAVGEGLGTRLGRELVAGIVMVANIDRTEGALCMLPRPPVEGSSG